MNRDVVVFFSVIAMVGCYGFYTMGYEKGEEFARKDCPHIPNKQLKFIEEEKGVVRCSYQNSRVIQVPASVRRAIS